jgi:predicted membrane protein
MTAPQDPYSYPGAPGGTGDYPAGPPRRQGAQIFSILAMVCGVIAILILPIVFGPIGIVLAVVANRRGEPLWKIALGVAIGGMVLGFILGAIVLSNS